MDIHMTAAPSQQTTSRSEHEPELSKSALLSAASHKHPSPAVARTPNPFRVLWFVAKELTSFFLIYLYCKHFCTLCVCSLLLYDSFAVLRGFVIS